MPNTEENEKRRQQLDVWLAKRKMSRKQFAAELGVSEASVYGWLSNTIIPNKRWMQIEAFFAEDTAPIRHRVVGSTFTDEEADRIRRAAGEKSIEEYLRETLLRQADKDLGEE